MGQLGSLPQLLFFLLREVAGFYRREQRGWRLGEGMSEEDLCEGHDQPHGPSLGGPQGAGWAVARGVSLSLKLGAQAC